MSPLRRGASLVARSIRAAAGRLRAARARLGGLPPRGTVRVSYGHPRLPQAGEPAVGGIVKLQELERRFPNSTARFNVLYLVSSRLPDEAIALAAAAAAKGAAVVVNQNGVAYPAWHGPGWEKTNAPFAALLAQASHVFYQSRFCKETADRFVGVEPRAWEILYNSVDTSRFVPSARLSRPLTLLLGGTQQAFYRVATALETLALVRRQVADARLLIAGTLRWSAARAARAETDELAARLDVASAIAFVGPYTQADAPGLYQRADLLLHTKYNDPCPTVVLEAMSSGLPVVYSRSGGVPELVGDEAGIGVAAELSWDRDVPPSAVEMAEAVGAALARRDTMSAAARRRAVEHFDRRAWVQRHAEVFQELAG